MLKYIIQKEIQENVISLRYIFLLMLCVVTISFSSYEMYKQYINNIEEHSYKTTDPNEILIKKQPSVLSVYISGTKELMDKTFIFNRDMYEPMELSSGINLNIFRQLFPTLDFLYLVKMLFSLLALILSFDLICGEKNEGTLKLILTNSVSKGKIIFGKLIANYILLIIL